MTLEQRRGTEKRRAEILADGVQVHYQSPTERQHYRVRFEDLLREPVEFTRKPMGVPVVRSLVLGLGLVFVFVSITLEAPGERHAGLLLGAACIVGAGLALLLERVPRHQLLQLSSADPALLVFPRTPSPEAVDEFVRALYERAESYIRQNYGMADFRETKTSQLERLFQLKQQGAITENEYQQLKSEVIAPVPAEFRSGQYI